MRHATFALFLLLLLLASGLSLASAQDDGDLIDYTADVLPRITFEHNDMTRAYHLYTPENTDESAPLVIALHRTGSSGNAMAILTELHDFMPGAIIAYADSAGTSWDFDAQNAAFDDIGFLPALVDHVAESHSIDRDQVHLVGMAAGGLMAMRVACETPEQFKSIAVVGVLMWRFLYDNCAATQAENDATTSMLFVHGSANVSYPMAGVTYQPNAQGVRPETLNVNAHLSAFAEWLDCDNQNVTTDGENLISIPCADDKTLSYYRVINGGFNWPRLRDGATLNQFGVDASALIAGYFSGDDDWATLQDVPEPDAEQPPRSYIVYAPADYTGEQPLPVIVSLHGRYGNGASMANLTGFNDMADREGFLVVYPDGMPNDTGVPGDTGWNYVRSIPYLRSEPWDDVLFLKNLMADLSLSFNMDPDRLYVNGLSNGGFMVNLLACDAFDTFAAFASVAGSSTSGLDDLCADSPPAPMMIVHGTADNNVTWDGLEEQLAEGVPIYTSLPLPILANFWAVHNGCDGDIETEELPQLGNSSGTSVEIHRAQDCDDGGAVDFYVVVNGGHNWPGVDSTLSPEILGNINRDFDAGEAMWAFYRQHSLADGS